MKNLFKYIIIFLSAFLFRLIPFRAPNLEPIMATLMPISKKNNLLMSFLFGFLSITLFDFATYSLGVWTLVTGVAYGLVGISSYFYFKKYLNSRLNYVLFSILATILYDMVTGLTIGPIVFGQSFMSAVIGQIPFTMIHLLGNVSFAMIISPVIDMFLVKENSILEINSFKVEEKMVY